jgi:hypothetical protein
LILVKLSGILSKNIECKNFMILWCNITFKLRCQCNKQNSIRFGPIHLTNLTPPLFS